MLLDWQNPRSHSTQKHEGGKKDRAHVQLFGNKSEAVSGMVVYLATPGLVFPPWYIQHHRPESPRLFSVFWLHRAPLSPSYLPASPAQTETTGWKHSPLPRREGDLSTWWLHSWQPSLPFYWYRLTRSKPQKHQYYSPIAKSCTSRFRQSLCQNPLVNRRHVANRLRKC